MGISGLIVVVFKVLDVGIPFPFLPTRNAVLSQLRSLGNLYRAKGDKLLIARLLPAIDKNSTLTRNESFTEPTVSRSGGFYDIPIEVKLYAANTGGSIYYTLDGSIPTTGSRYYDKPVYIDKTSVLRFRRIESGKLPNPTVTHTYLIEKDIRLPVLSLVTDPEIKRKTRGSILC